MHWTGLTKREERSGRTRDFRIQPVYFNLLMRVMSYIASEPKMIVQANSNIGQPEAIFANGEERPWKK